MLFHKLFRSLSIRSISEHLSQHLRHLLMGLISHVNILSTISKKCVNISRIVLILQKWLFIRFLSHPVVFDSLFSVVFIVISIIFVYFINFMSIFKLNKKLEIYFSKFWKIWKMQFSQHSDWASGQIDFLTYSIYRFWSLLFTIFTILLTITTIQIKLIQI